MGTRSLWPRPGPHKGRDSRNNRGMAILAAIVVLAAFQTNFYQDGLKALDAQQYQAAADDFTKVLAADPKDFTAHFNLAFAYSMLNRDADSIAEYKKTLELKPGLYQAD